MAGRGNGMKQWTIALTTLATGICMVALLLVATVFAMQEQVTGEVSRVEIGVNEQMDGIREMAEQAIAFAFSPDQEATDVKEERTDAATVLQIDCYDAEGVLLGSEETVVPSYLIGLTREQVERFFEGIYDEFHEEFGVYAITGASLSSFSSERIVVSKTAKLREQGFYVHALNDSVVVYYADKETIFEATGIPLSDLSEREQLRIRQGIYVETKEDLFSLLEAYTS